MVAIAWTRLYGFPWDIRLWFAFFLHDIGYWGLGDMDGEEGKQHPVAGAMVMEWLFGSEWFHLCFYHSRSTAKWNGVEPSKLCAADKLACAIEPDWLYLPRVIATGEVKEYLQLWKDYCGEDLTPKEWRKKIKPYMEAEAYKCL